MTTALDFLNKVATVAHQVGFHAGVGGMELAGQIISCLHAQPEQIDRFMAEGAELFLDGTFEVAKGSLTYQSIGNGLQSPTETRRRLGTQQ